MNEETCNRILELAASLIYTINVSARELCQGSNHTIAAVVSGYDKRRQDQSDRFFSQHAGPADLTSMANTSASKWEQPAQAVQVKNELLLAARDAVDRVKAAA